MTAVKVVCRGWFGVHAEVRVLQAGPDATVSDGICSECEAAADLEYEAEQEQRRQDDQARPCPCGRMTINDCAGECGIPDIERNRP